MSDPSKSGKSKNLLAHLEHCTLCPRRCGVNRRNGERGFCRAGPEIRIGGHGLHRGEEPPLSGPYGSGAIFFTFCTLRCCYCQNFPVSHLDRGKDFSVRGVSDLVIELQERKATTINLVTPTHHSVGVIEAIAGARRKGLTIPVVFNSGGYERVETIRLWKGTADIYLADMKYGSSPVARAFSDTPDYPAVNRKAVLEMWRQVGPLVIDPDGRARKGLIIRHLLLPGMIDETRKTLSFISRRISTDVHVSMMSQYFPAGNANLFPELARRISPKEKIEARKLLREHGLEKGWVQSTGVDPAIHSIDRFLI